MLVQIADGWTSCVVGFVQPTWTRT
jgi:hypothetical protein